MRARACTCAQGDVHPESLFLAAPTREHAPQFRAQQAEEAHLRARYLAAVLPQTDGDTVTARQACHRVNISTCVTAFAVR
jgi:hypothetical protein